MDTSWETQLADLLGELSDVQDDLLATLSRKRELLVAGDAEGLSAVAPKEEQLIERLQQCMQRRQDLLDQAGAQGLPTDSIESLAQALPKAQREPLGEKVEVAKARGRLLKHHSLTNWVVIQRTLIHLSQVLEIIATGGRLKPTYGEEEAARASGALLDRAG